MTTTDSDTTGFAADATGRIVQHVHWEIDYQVKLGRTWSRFMKGLQNQELWGSVCQHCSRTYVPAQDYCEACYEHIEEWRQLEPVGTLRAATIVYQGFDGGPEVPYAVGAIEVDGTDSLFMHFIGGVDLGNPEAARARLVDGLRVRARWAAERSGAITDIAAFDAE